jgi:hypothetical protein
MKFARFAGRLCTTKNVRWCAAAKNACIGLFLTAPSFKARAITSSLAKERELGEGSKMDCAN